MSYPVQILPNPKYKLIECDIKDSVVMRNTSSSEISEIWDFDFQQINAKELANPTERVFDMSTNLLGIFELVHCKIYFTDIGIPKYILPCSPDIIVDEPLYPEEFALKGEVGVIFSLIKDLTDIVVAYENRNDKDKYIGKSFVKHTPMKWNYWHFSVDWNIKKKNESEDDYVTIDYNHLSRGMRKQIGGLARAELVKRFRIECPNFTELREECYLKNHAMPQQVT